MAKDAEAVPRLAGKIPSDLLAVSSVELGPGE